MSNNLELYNDIVEKIENLPSVDSALSKIGDATLAHFLTRELNLLIGNQVLADREAHLGSYAEMEQAVIIATIQMLQSVIENRSDSPTAIQEALQDLVHRRFADKSSSLVSTEWLLP